MMRALTIAAALGGGGCAVGYGAGYTSANLATPKTDPSVAPRKWSAMYQELRLIDTTGLALAALVNAGRQYNARQDAMEEAVRRAQYAQPGETVRVEYSWDPMPILAGLITDVRLRFPFSATIEQPVGYELMREEVSYWGFSVRSEFKTFRPVKSIPLVSSLFLGLDVSSWKAAMIADYTTDESNTTLDMPFGASTSYVVSENLTATGRLSIGTLSPLLGLFNPGSTKFNPAAEAEIGYRPYHTDKYGVVISGIAAIGREFVANVDGQPMWSPRIGVSVAVTFGMQKPKAVRERESEPSPPPGEQPAVAGTPAAASDLLSGQVCLGASPVPECTRVANEAPEHVKVLWLACAQATVKATETGQLGSQPTVCRTAGDGIANSIKQGHGQGTPEEKRVMYVAAAGAYDLAAVGFESGAKLGPEHCAMVERTYNFVIGPDGNQPLMPDKVATVGAALEQCRAKFVCMSGADGALQCTPKTP